MAKTQQLTKESLLEEATQQFSRHGFSEASVRSICKQVGGSVAAINYHFGNKNNLVATVVENAIQKFSTALEESFNESPNDLSGFLFSYGMKLSHFKKEILITFRNMFTLTTMETEFSEKLIQVMDKFFSCSHELATAGHEREFSSEEIKERVKFFNSVVTMEILKRTLMPNAVEYPNYEEWLRRQIDFILKK